MAVILRGWGLLNRNEILSLLWILAQTFHSNYDVLFFSDAVAGMCQQQCSELCCLVALAKSVVILGA